MAVNTMPQKRFKYYVQEDDETAVELTIDPKGWDGHEVGFDRTEDFGLNIQNVVPLSFSGAGRLFLKGVYEANGIFGKTKTIIKKRMNDWTYALFYQYKHDYSTYKDNLHFVEIAGLEDGLAKKFDTYKDTEYEIDLPSTNKVFIDYSGANYTTTNQIQAGAGSIQDFQKPDIKAGADDDAYALRGSRAVRAYNNKVAFTDGEGLPYETMTFRAIESVTISVILYRNVTIEADAAILQSTPASGTLQLIEHNTAFGSPIVAKRYPTNTDIIYSATSSTTPANNRIDVFSGSETFNIALTAGKLYTLFYIADEKSYDDIIVSDGLGCYIDISNEVTSVYQNAKLECFTYEWLINELLQKIDPTAEQLASEVTYPHVKELLTCTPCIRNMGNTSGTGKIKTTLKDVLESFHKLKCVGWDIDGSTMTIKPLESFYPKLVGDYYGEIEANNIVVEHDFKHQYNKVKVGADTEDRQDDDPLIYPFICEKEFKVSDTIADNELDLMNNFMLDPYAIDKYIIDTLGTADNKDECNFAVMACKGFPLNSTLEIGESLDSVGYTYITNDLAKIVSNGTETILNRVLVFTNNNYQIEKSSLHLFSFKSTKTGQYYFDIEIRTNTQNGISDIERQYSLPTGFVVTLDTSIDETENNTFIHLKFNGVIEDSSTFNFDFFLKILQGFQGLGIYDVRINGSTIFEVYNGYIEIYKDHDNPITDFSGDSATIYNIPLTPKRILQRWQNYIAISVVGKTTKALEFGTSTILKSAITSRCDYESSAVVENSDLSLTGITPVFLPTTISCDTQENPTIDNFIDKKYKYIKVIDKKTGNEYQGWINSITFAIAKNKSRQIMLQAKEI